MEKNHFSFLKLTALACVGLTLASIETSYSACWPEGNILKADSSGLIKSTPEWMKNEPIIMVGNWDSAPIFRIRKGGYQKWDMEDYPRTHSEEAIIRLKQMGVTMAMIHFYKGFGLEAEKSQLEDAKKLAALCKKHGLRVGVYVGSTIAFETFLVEMPEAQSWLVPNYLGQPVTYGGTQTFRKKVYFMHPGYVAYMKKVVRIAIEDLHADLIHFDNTAGRGLIPVFFHPLAIEDFRSYLRNNYSPSELEERLGFSNVTYVEPPAYNGPLNVMIDPLFQLWTDFRCRQLAGFYAEMERFIKGLNPQVAVENNPAGLTGSNSMWGSSIDYPRLLPHTDAFWDESANPDYTNDSVLISKIRTYKMAALFNNTVFTYTGDNKLDMSEAMAYNRQCIGMVGGMLTGYELSETRTNRGFDNPYTEGTARESHQDMENKAQYVRFFNDNFQYYRGVENIADVAVLHTYASMAYDNNRPYQSTYLIEQALIQGKIPFDVIFDNNLNDLSKYRVLVIGDQKCLSDQNMKLITDYVKKGGGLVATENTSLYTERFARRENFGLRDLFQTDAPVWRGYDVEQADNSISAKNEQMLNLMPKKNNIEKGRVVYLSEIIPSRAKPSGEGMISRYWRLPKNNLEILESVKWAAKDNLSLTVKAPVFVTVELTQSIDKSKIMLHLVNYNTKRTDHLMNTEVTMEIPAGKKPRQVKVLSPDIKETKSIAFQVLQGKIWFVIPELNTYDLVVMEME